jgi:hypothetical protein
MTSKSPFPFLFGHILAKKNQKKCNFPLTRAKKVFYNGAKLLAGEGSSLAPLPFPFSNLGASPASAMPNFVNCRLPRFVTLSLAYILAATANSGALVAKLPQLET